MDDVILTAPPHSSSQDHLLLRRRNSLSACKLSLPAKYCSGSTSSSSSSSSFPSDDMELLTIKPCSHSYTSIKDLLPLNAVNSPKPNTPHQAQTGLEISIRNRLVQQAAWAYLQPMSTSSGSSADNFFRRLWPRVADFVDLVRRGFVRVFDWTLRVIRIRICR